MYRGLLALIFLPTVLLFVVGCGGQGQATRTPVPTWTATPIGGTTNVTTSGNASNAVQASNEGELAVSPANTNPPAQQSVAITAIPTVAEAATPTLTTQSENPTNTPEPTATPVPTEIPTETPTETPAPPEFAFDLETAEKFPSDSLAANVVRIFLYVYANGELGLSGYTIAVKHDGVELPVEAVSIAGLPTQTRTEASPYTRFTNMNSIFIEPQGGVWEVQLVDDQGALAGPPARIELAPDDVSRELYVRYRRK
ncbi:MAG: hypothetical protein AAF702_10005 [Chloroflexota bacterium]